MEILRQSLEEISENSESDLVKAVIDDVLEYGDDEEIESYIEQVLNYGCQSGVVGSLIYYYQTEEFFKKHSVEILNIVNDINQECGSISFEMDSNTLAWLGYEETLRKINDETMFARQLYL